MKTFIEYRDEIMQAINVRPSSWRKGQAAFNYVYHNYGFGNALASTDKDCFYNDNNIEEFIKITYFLYKDPNLRL